VTDSALVLRNMNFSNNATTGSGGALWVGLLSEAQIHNSTFTNNSADFDGGAVYNQETMLISGSTFSGNSADGFGGAIGAHGQTTVFNSTIVGNIAGNDRGGGIYSSSTTKFAFMAQRVSMLLCIR
jgi:predicted outer membrane repeat protein